MLSFYLWWTLTDLTASLRSTVVGQQFFVPFADAKDEQLRGSSPSTLAMQINKRIAEAIPFVYGGH